MNNKNKIPNGWEVKRLGNVCTTFKSGNGITSESIFDTGDYPVYGGNGLRGYTNSYTHDGNYFLIGRQGALCGNIVRVTGKNYISEHAIAVQTNIENDNSFLAYKLEFQNLNRLSESSAQPGLSVEKLLKIKVLLPKLPEQKNIVHILSIWDKAIEKTSQLITQKENRKKWLMQQLLTGKKRLKGLRGEWKEVKLGEIFEERNETGRVELSLLSITGEKGVILQSESDKRDNSNEDKSKYKRICIGDIGYNTMRMWQGRSALSELEGIVSPAYTIVTPKKEADSKYFAYLFKQPNIINLFFRNSQGLVDDTLNCKFKDFEIIKILIPKKEEQVAIRNVLQIDDEEIKLLKDKLEQLKEQKKGLMQILLTGKKRLKIKK